MKAGESKDSPAFIYAMKRVLEAIEWEEGDMQSPRANIAELGRAISKALHEAYKDIWRLGYMAAWKPEELG